MWKCMIWTLWLAVQYIGKYFSNNGDSCNGALHSSKVHESIVIIIIIFENGKSAVKYQIQAL